MPKLKGVWKFKKTVELQNIEASLDFLNRAFYYFDSSKIESYIRIIVTTSGISYRKLCHDILGEFTQEQEVYTSAGWANEDQRRIDILYEIEVSQEFYDWFTANAEDITDTVTQIFYNGRLIGVLENGERVTIPCKGLPMIEDIIISAPKTNIA